MNLDDLFSNAPKVEPKRKPKPSRKKKKAPTFKERREAGQNPEHNFIPWDERDEEQRARDIEHEKNYIRKMVAKSVRFRKLRYRRALDRQYRNKHGYPTKKCTKCGKMYSKIMFDKIKDPKKGKDVRRPYCVLCRKKMNAEYYQRRKHANNT